MTTGAFLHETAAFRDAAGVALRPGGVEATARALDRCRWPEGGDVADVGCGRGATLWLLRGRGYRARGFDASAAMAAEAAALSGCVAHVAGAERLPVADGVFDGLVCECLPFTPSDYETALREFARVLKPGGGLLLAGIVDTRGGAAPDSPPAPEEVAGHLDAAGFAVLHTVVLDNAVTALAAQLVWRGCEREALAKLTGAGYRQWIAEKQGERS